MMKKYLIAMALCCGLGVSVAAQSSATKMDRFIDRLMSKMTLQEKIGQLNLLNPGGGVPTGAAVSTGVEAKIKEGMVGGLFGVAGPEKVRKAQGLAQESRMKIPLIIGSDVIHGYKTTFPIPLALSCSWDMNLIEQTARAAADEATADGVDWTFSPMVDISRDPRWGRVAEGGGEDPYLGAQIARAMVTGYQQNDLSSGNTMLATVKHFALYGAVEAGREYNTTDMSHLRMYNDYFPPYKAAVAAGAGSVMSSFNDVDGLPSTGNKWLLTDVLRHQWGFKGFVVSDYTSLGEMIKHGVGATMQDVSALALNAGLDMDMMSEGFVGTLEKSLREGKVTEAQINNACRLILEAKYKLGLFDDPYRYGDARRAKKEILSPAHRALARKAAEHSFVLLKNMNQVLPLKKNAKIALIGPLADDQNNMLGTWAVSGDYKNSIPVLQGMKNVAPQARISYAKGANISNDPAFAKKVNVFGPRITIDSRSPEVMLQEALQKAQQSDVIVAVVGEASEMSGECSSRTDISLPECQKQLIRALAKTGKPLVLVIMAGRPLTIGDEYQLTDGLLYTWHAGMEAGNAIADVLFGNYNPSGKLTMSFPRNVGQIPVYYNHKSTGRPDPQKGFHKFFTHYLDCPNSPLFSFGYGLSYTHFKYGKVKLSRSVMNFSDSLTVSVNVTNTGKYDGEEVVELYTHDLVGTITRPVKELKGFKKVMLSKGATKNVTFRLTAGDLAYYHADMSFSADPGDFDVFVGGSSDVTNPVRFTLTK